MSENTEEASPERTQAPEAVDYEGLARQVVRLMAGLRRPHPGPPPVGPGPRCCGKKGHSEPPARQLGKDGAHPDPRPPFPSDLRDASRGTPIVLAFLGHEGGSATPGKLCELSGLSKGRVSNIVRSLEAKGYVEKAPAPQDARSVVVTLTDKGRAFTDAHEQAMVGHTAAILRQLGPRDARDAVRILGHLADIMEAGAPFPPCEGAEAPGANGKEAR